MDGSRGVVRTIQSFWTPVSTGEFTRTDGRTSITTVRVLRFVRRTCWSSALRLFRAANMLKHELQRFTFEKERTLSQRSATNTNTTTNRLSFADGRATVAATGGNGRVLRLMKSRALLTLGCLFKGVLTIQWTPVITGQNAGIGIFAPRNEPCPSGRPHLL